jgi:N-acetylmuramoyl-L-alanine amidase
VGGLLEKDVTLSVAMELEALLRKDADIRVIVTRRNDKFVPLAQRTEIANSSHADLFISLHNNASPQHQLSGLEVFYLDLEGDDASRKLAERENASVQFEGAGGDLSYMLSDLIQHAKVGDSIRLAETIKREALGEVEERWGKFHDLGVKKAPFYVLVGAHMPCVLVEMFFIDNPEEGKRLAQREFRQSLARGLHRGIRHYLKSAKKG